MLHGEQKIRELMRFLAIFLVIFLPVNCLGEELTAVVKVESSPCANTTQPFRGSGMIFQHQGSLFVLTSDHVILNGGSDYCHSIRSSTLSKRPAEVVATSWEEGMAVLKFAAPELDHSALPDLTVAPRQKARNGDAITVAGFPYGSENLLVNGRAFVSDIASERHLLVGVERMIEINDGKGEFGMSGGPIFLRDEMIGMLSHQYLKLVAGAPSEVGEYERDTTMVENQLLAIGRQKIAQWLKQIFSGKESAGLYREPEDQISGQKVLHGFGIRLELVPRPPTATLIKAGGDGTGIGGGKNWENDTNLSVLVSKEAQKNPKRIREHAGPAWLVRLRESLALSEQLRIPYFSTLRPPFRKAYFSSLEEFLFLAKHPEMVPIRFAAGENRGDLPGEIKNLLLQAKFDLNYFQQTYQAKFSAPVSAALEEMARAAEILGSRDWRLVTYQYWNAVLKNPEEPNSAWYHLFSMEFTSADDFDRVSRMYGTLGKIRDVLKQLR